LLRNRFRRQFCVWLCLVSAAGCPEAQAQPAELSFHIPAQPIADALIKFARQARISIGYGGIDFRTAVANPVDGRYAPRDALQALLSGTGYGYMFLDPDTIEIRSPTLAQPGPAGPPAIEEIIVTSTKRAEVARLLPYAIAAETGAQLQDSGAEISSDIAPHVAALTASNLGPGQSKLFIRGLSDSAFSGRSQSMVGLYLDESRLTDNAPDPDLRLVDIDRVEIVRGPRGTLYGAGALGGLVRIITNKPVLDREESMVAIGAAATEHGGPSGGIDAMLNIPIAPGTIGIRAVGYGRIDGGYIDNARRHLGSVNRTDTGGGRAGLRWQLDDDWAVTAGLTYQAIAAADSQYARIGQPPLTQTHFIREPHDDRFLQANLMAEGHLDWADLVSSSAYTGRRIGRQLDATSAWNALTGFRIGRSAFNDTRDIQSFTHETRLVSPSGERWSWVAGAFMSHRTEEYQSSLIGPDALRHAFLARAEARKDHANEAALFGEATYHVTTAWSVTAGVRAFYSQLDAAARVGRAGTGADASASGENHKVGTVPKAVVNFQPTRDLTVYASASEGFRLGGVNINSPIGAINIKKRRNGTPNARTFDSDSLWTYETGVKASLFGGRLVASTAAYLTIWDNIQSDQILRDGSLYTANAGSARVPGVELDMTLQATEHLRIQGNFFWNDPEIVSPNPLLIRAQGRLPAVPDSSFGLSGRYDQRLTDALDSFLSLDVTHVGHATLGFDARNSPSMGNYFLSNARLGLDWGPWEGMLYVDNLGDQRANSFAFGNPFSFATEGQITPLRPRTVGFRLRWAD